MEFLNTKNTLELNFINHTSSYSAALVVTVSTTTFDTSRRRGILVMNTCVKFHLWINDTNSEDDDNPLQLFEISWTYRIYPVQ